MVKMSRNIERSRVDVGFEILAQLRGLQLAALLFLSIPK